MAKNDVETSETSETTEKKLSPKAKSVLGIPEDMSICWIPFPLNDEDDKTVAHVAKLRDVKKYAVLSNILGDALLSHIEELREEAKAYVPTTATRTGKSRKKVEDMTQEELDNNLKAAQKRIEAAQAKAAALMAAAKARSAAASA